MKPLNAKSYGSIGHLPSSRMGPADHHITPGQERILTKKTRDKHDLVICQEKLDGSNVGVYRRGDEILALTRAGYLAISSKFAQHHKFDYWVSVNAHRFRAILKDGERLCGEWLYQAHGTRYQLTHEPFVAFDLIKGQVRALHDEMVTRVDRDSLNGGFITATVLHKGFSAFSIADAVSALGVYGHHGALDVVEGAVWRVERNGVVDFLAKYVRPSKVDGVYLPEISGKPAVINEGGGV